MSHSSMRRAARNVSVRRREPAIIEQMFRTTLRGDKAALSEILNAGADFEARPSQFGEDTALYKAAESGHVAVTELLLDRGADIEARSGSIHGKTPFYAAVENGHRDVVKLLLERGAQIEARSDGDRRCTPLFAAVLSGNRRMVELLLRQRHDIPAANVNVRSGDSQGTTSLIEAVQARNVDMVELLLASGARTDLKADGGTKAAPLHIAAHKGYGELVEILLNAGASVDAKSEDYYHTTPLYAAAANGHREIVRCLLNRPRRADINEPASDQKAPLHAAAENGHEKVVQVLLNHGAEVNARDQAGYQPAHYAIRRGHTAVLQVFFESDVDGNLGWVDWGLYSAVLEGSATSATFFIDKGAQLNRPFQIHETPPTLPLHLAVALKHEDVVTLLLQRGAEVDKKDDGRTALVVAIEEDYPSIVRILLHFRAEVNLRDVSGDTLVHLTASKGQLEILQMLLEYGANPYETDKFGQIPLFANLDTSQPGVVRVLLQAGRVDPNAKNNKQQSALHVATRHRRADMVRVLLENGADPNIRDAVRGTPLLYATRDNQLGIAEILLDHGAKPRSTDRDGWTPVGAAQQLPDDMLYRVLKKKEKAMYGSVRTLLRRSIDPARSSTIPR